MVRASVNKMYWRSTYTSDLVTTNLPEVPEVGNYDREKSNDDSGVLKALNETIALLRVAAANMHTPDALHAVMDILNARIEGKQLTTCLCQKIVTSRTPPLHEPVLDMTSSPAPVEQFVNPPNYNGPNSKMRRRIKAASEGYQRKRKRTSAPAPHDESRGPPLATFDSLRQLGFLKFPHITLYFGHMEESDVSDALTKYFANYRGCLGFDIEYEPVYYIADHPKFTGFHFDVVYGVDTVCVARDGVSILFHTSQMQQHTGCWGLPGPYVAKNVKLKRPHAVHHLRNK